MPPRGARQPALVLVDIAPRIEPEGVKNIIAFMTQRPELLGQKIQHRAAKPALKQRLVDRRQFDKQLIVEWNFIKITI